MRTRAQPSRRRQIWTRIGILVVVLVPALILVALTLTPNIMNLSGPTATEDSIFFTGLGGLIVGLVGLGFAPRGASTVYLNRAGLYKRPSLTGGIIALSILFAGIILLILGAVMSSV